MTRAWLVLCALVALVAAGAKAAPPPAEAYVLHCSGCHGSRGDGVAGMIPSLHGLAVLAAQPAGREYLARVPGVAQAPVGDAELAELLNWVLREFSHARDLLPYTADELRVWRRQPLRDPVRARPNSE